MHMLLMFVLLAIAAIANIVGHKLGLVRADQWLVTMLLFAAALVTAGLGVHGRWDGIFIDRENRISLSRLQLILWTLILISAILTAGLTNAVAQDPTPLEIEIPKEIWGLLGLGVFTAVAAPAITDARLSAPDPQKTDLKKSQKFTTETLKVSDKLAAEPTFIGDVLVKASPADARWMDLIRGDNDAGAWVDVSKLQQLALTAALALVYSLALWETFDGSTAYVDFFPPIDGGFLALLGISHAAYLADKRLAST